MKRRLYIFFAERAQNGSHPSRRRIERFFRCVAARDSALCACLIGLGFSAFAAAQDKVNVPLSSPNQPVTLKVSLISGSITVTTGSGSEVVVTGEGVRGQERERNRGNIPPGMHRIDGGATGFNVTEDHNVVTVSGGIDAGRGSNISVQVPVNTSVELKTINGGKIDVTGINGDIDVENTNGGITLRNVSGAVSAHTLNGGIEAVLTKVAPDKAMSFSSLNGRVDVTLPADTKARLRLKNSNGEIYSDFDVKMEADNSKPVVEDNRGKGGKYRIKVDRGVYGSINGGGPEYQFQTMNGTILIHKK